MGEKIAMWACWAMIAVMFAVLLFIIFGLMLGFVVARECPEGEHRQFFGKGQSRCVDG